MASLSDVQAGDVIRFSYIDRKGDSKVAEVYVLNPDHEKMLHGLKMEELDNVDINQIYKVVLPYNRSKIEDYQRGDLDVDYWTIDNPRDFYYKKLRGVFGGGEKVPYRTYKTSKMGNITILDNPIKDKLETQVDYNISGKVDKSNIPPEIKKRMGID